MSEKNVSIIIPSYNRAHILKEVIPSYFQDETLEVIVINDGSTDNTNSVLAELKEKYSQLVILENETNKKQMYSKNRGIEIAKGKYIFFGDDDSYLLPGVISRLLATKYETGADVIGARILYMNNNEKTIEDCINRHKKEGRFVSDLNRLDFSYTCDLDHPIECFYAQPFVLAERELISKYRFDISYTGNCYREETDFMLSLFIKNKKFIYDSKALLINLLPRKATGGARTANRLKYHYESCINNYRFLKKYNDNLNLLSGQKHAIFYRQCQFVLLKMKSFIGKFLK